jgi:ribonucleotide reductase alpha subunit
MSLNESVVDYFGGDDLAADVFNKYALRDVNGNRIENLPTETFRRLAKEFARIEAKYPNPMSEDSIFELLDGFKKVVPQGSPLSGIGNPHQLQSLSNCFVIDQPHDSYGGILFADQEQVQIMKRRGGVGMDVSKIRPKGQPTTNAARTTDGIGVFMERFSNSTREVAQGGRRGALMLTIDCRHPEIETFIDIKRDLKKVTGANISIRFTDEFMQAVEHNQSFCLRWPVEAHPEDAEIVKMVDAKQVWDKFVDAAWAAAEPGALFWDTVVNQGVVDCYRDVGYKTISTNPCVTGDTEVMVADGRGFVAIKTLADEGNDVPVFACDEGGKLVIKTMRNPRVTGKNAQIYRVTVEGGHSFRATGNHKMIMRDGSEREVKDLIAGDSLWISHHVNGKFNEAMPGLRASTSQDYSWIRSGGNRTWKSAHRIMWEHFNGKKIGKDEVIHHADFNSLNNHPSNLVLMSKEDHDRFHADLIKGENNPIFKIKADPVRFAEYSEKMSKSVGGMNNPRAYEVSNDSIIDAIAKLTININRRVTRSDWTDFAKENNFPIFLNDFRLDGKSFSEVCYEIAIFCGINSDICDMDPRVARRALHAESEGYRWQVASGDLHVEKTCEWCKTPFWSEYDKREVSFCGHSCANKYANRRAGKNQRRSSTLRAMHASNGEKKRQEQLEVFTSLRSTLGRVPLAQEWETACKKSGCSSRTGTQHGFASWSELKTAAESFNHRVVSVELAGNEDVYNGTVDDVHTFCFRVGSEEIERFRNKADLILASRQCGEIPLSPYDSCRLMVVNLTSFVLNPFTSNAKFDYDSFISVVGKAQRLMDDLVDLEVECVDRILEKIENDPQPASVKQIERDLWNKIRNAGLNGRRTGLGITGLGDTLAGLNIRYGSQLSIEMTEAIYQHLAMGAHRSSCQLAAERGAFPVFDYSKEKDHPYLARVMSACGTETINMWQTTGRRNIALTTTAPVGSISCLTQTTSGIEPAFLLSYKRRRKITQGDTKSVADYVDPMGDKWQEYTVYHHWFKKWMDVTGKSDPKESPYWGGTANDIDWEKSVEIQAAAQKWIDHSISKTCNLPNAATKETVNNVYVKAWKMGCKGFTVYRDGCRTGVLVSTEEKKEEKPKAADTHPKRPKELPCDIHRVNVKDESGKAQSWMVLVGLKDGAPYEVFSGLANHIVVPKKTKSGTMVKNGKVNGLSTYNLRVPVGADDEILFKDVANLFANPTQGAFSRTISLALRHGVPVNFVVDQLQKDKDSDMFTYARCIARVLKSYIPDGTKSTTEKKCKECGSDQVFYMEGCLTCSSCGSSKCS